VLKYDGSGICVFRVGRYGIASKLASELGCLENIERYLQLSINGFFMRS
jgi:hypothetical protein